MDNNTILIVCGVVAVLVIVAAALLWRRQTSERLRSRFGPEYVRAVEDAGGQRQAEAALQTRAARVRKYELRPLTAEDRDRFSESWRQVQAQFVDDPRAAAQSADDLLGEVMSLRGYPAADFGQRLEDLSVDHGDAVQNYRVARDIVQRNARGDAGTEDMRQAMIHYRTLFEDLLGEPAAAAQATETETSYA
jgi:FtsZ-interacting cell division protein ZipA